MLSESSLSQHPVELTDKGRRLVRYVNIDSQDEIAITNSSVFIFDRNTKKVGQVKQVNSDVTVSKPHNPLGENNTKKLFLIKFLTPFYIM